MTERGNRCMLAVALFAGMSTLAFAQTSPHDIAKRVADRIVTETRFEFAEGLPAGEQEGYYHIDFADAGQSNSSYGARAEIHVDGELSAADLDELALGISFTKGKILIEIDGTKFFEGEGDNAILDHLDYGLVRPASSVPLNIRPGKHEITVQFESAGPQADVWLGLIRSDNELAFEGAEIVLPDGLENGDVSRFLVKSGDGGWFVPSVPVVRKLPHKLAYSDWRYFTGTFLDAMFTVSDTFEDLDYQQFIGQHLDHFSEQRHVIADERKAYGLIESPFGHYFRFSLLDDMGMQTVPFAERLRRNPDGSSADVDREIVWRSVDHIMDTAARLSDGTWARLNPDSLTVWADDLFMGSILLSRVAVMTGDSRYFEEAVRQTLQIDKYLNDPESGLYWHGYFNRSGEHSSSKWGRANGWTMMAKTELLNSLPADHPGRDRVLAVFQRHAAALIAIQSDDGRWHQVLDNPDTYLETSCTAMFTRAFAEGVRQGWLPDEGYREAAERGWHAVASQVRDDGMVEGIVRGTPIFYSDQEYQDHPTRLNDPRGLGAVLYAAASMYKLSGS